MPTGRLLAGLLLTAGSAVAATPCEELIEQHNTQLEAMARHAAVIEATLNDLNAALQRAERRNLEQAAEIERLQAALAARRVSDPAYHDRLQRDFFVTLRRRLPVSSLYEVGPDRLIVSTDPVFIFGKGEIGTEGRDRLAPVVAALRDLTAELPVGLDWRLRVEGHSDSRPLRSNPRFADNWELSSARALSFLKLLVAGGIPDRRLSAVGLADTRLRDPGDATASHRRNRRIEVYLETAGTDPEPGSVPGGR